MALDIHFKRSRLRVAHERLAPAANRSLRDWMLDQIVALSDQVAGGPAGSIRATAGGGHSVQFSETSTTDAQEAVSLWSELLDLFDEAKAALVSAGIAVPTETQTVTEMLSRLVPVREYHSDFSCIREGVLA